MVAVQHLEGEIIQLVLSRKEGGHNLPLYSEIHSVWRDGLVSATPPKRLIGFK